MIQPWVKHHGGHVLLAAGIAFLAMCFHLSIWFGLFLGCIVFPTMHEAIEVEGGSRATADWRDHAADWVSYQLPWVFALAGNRLYLWAGAVAVVVTAGYVATLRWARPGPYQS
jgi:CDP-diglyceride synthetase